MGARLPLPGLVPGLVLSVALAACASGPAPNAPHGTHGAPETGRSTPAMCPQKSEMMRRMARVQAATDPAEKERLIAEHHQAMQEGGCAAH